MRPNRKRLFIIMLIADILILSAVIAAICILHGKRTAAPDESQPSVSDSIQNENAETEDPASYRIVSITEDGEWMVAETTYGKIRYPFAFSDLIVMEAVDLQDSAQLKVSLMIEERTIPVYTIHYNTNAGSVLGVLNRPDFGESFSVSVVFEEVPADLGEDWVGTFSAVMETFNDILISMMEDENFRLAE